MLCLLLELCVAFIRALIWGAVKLGFVRAVTWMNLSSAAEVSLCLPFLGRSSCEPISSSRLKVFVLIFARYFQFLQFSRSYTKVMMDRCFLFTLLIADFNSCQIGVSTVYQPDFCTRKLMVTALRNSTNEPEMNTGHICEVKTISGDYIIFKFVERRPRGCKAVIVYSHSICQNP